MLRRLYIYVLRLHPPAFRQHFGDEMLSIFDHSTGNSGGLRLLLDCFVSLVRQWTLRPEFWLEQPSDSAPAAVDGVPSFSTLDPFQPKTAALIHGLLLSSILFAATCFAIRYSWIHLLHVRIPEVQFSPAVPEAMDSDDSDRAPVAAEASPAMPGTNGGNGRRAQASPHKGPQSQGEASPGPKPIPVVLPGPLAQMAAAQPRGDRIERHRVIQAAATNLRQSYFDSNVAQKTAAALLAHEQNGDYDRVTDDAAFAHLLTKQMQEVSHDRHLNVEYSVSPFPVLGTPSAQALAHYRQSMAQLNCTFERVRILPQNIGYIKLNSFPDPSVCESTARAAMTFLNQADAIIFDLRENGGGEPAMVALVASYLFDHPEYWYNPREGTSARSWTRSPVPGNRLADKPVYVLTSTRTYSGAEQFTYDLKMLKRATIVGETTGGAAHAGAWHRINDHFGIGVPEVKAINPYADIDWAEVGVEPDVRVTADDALRTAEQLAQVRLRRR